MIKMQEIKQEVIRRLQAESQADTAFIAYQLGLGFQTLQKIRTGRTPDPRFDTVAKLVRHYGIRATDFGSKEAPPG